MRSNLRFATFRSQSLSGAPREGFLRRSFWAFSRHDELSWPATQQGAPIIFDCFQLHLFRFRRFRSPVRDYKWRRGGWANWLIHEKAFALHHIVFCTLRELEQGSRLTEAMLLEVNHRNSNDVPVVSSIKKFLAIAAPARIVTAAEGNLSTARSTRAEGPYDNFN